MTSLSLHGVKLEMINLSEDKFLTNQMSIRFLITAQRIEHYSNLVCQITMRESTMSLSEYIYISLHFCNHTAADGYAFITTLVVYKIDAKAIWAALFIKN